MRRFAMGLLFLFVVSVVVAQGPGMTPFSGDMNMKFKDGKEMPGKVYFGGTKMRFEMTMGGRDSILINDAANQVSYMLMPQAKMYMEMRAGQMMRGMPKLSDLKAYDPSNPCAQSTEVTCEKAGSENVNGRDTDKWLFKNKKDGSTSTSWLDKKLHFPIRTVSKDVQMDLTNVREGAPSASLFEIPAGYRKFDMGSMMGGQAPPPGIN